MSGFNSGLPEGTSGHHNSRVANAADPRIDSDRDHRAAPGTTTGLGNTTGLESSHHSTGIHEPSRHAAGTHEGGLMGSTHEANRGLSGPASKTDGPHKSDLLNKADPRVDSDRDHSKNMGMNPGRDATTATGRTAGASTTQGGNTLGSTHGTTGLGSSTHGTTGTHGTHGTTGLTGSHGSAPEGTHGPHSSRAANAADPRVDSDRDHRANHGTTGTHGKTTGASGLGNTHSTGPAPNTAGPHKSDLLNKLDPRVDSDLDGSKTVGGNKTHAH